MFKKAPEDYKCPFCRIANNQPDDTGEDRTDEIVYSDTEITGFISSHWWPDVEGPVLIIPNKHYENIFDLPDELLVKISLLSKKIASAMMKGYGCEGVSFRQHNLAGNQSVFHYHMQVLPRHDGDRLYQNHEKKYPAESIKRKERAQLIRENMA
jgi:histidine triad (HIT) family protein